MHAENVTDEIVKTVRSMNRCWTEGFRKEQFRQFIHPDAVAIGPSVPGRLEGKEAYTAAWKNFTENAAIHEWTEYDHHVNLSCRNTCAVVTYLFSITFTMDGQNQVMKGRDMMVLIKTGGRWLIVADQFSPEPAPAGLCPEKPVQ